MAVKRWENMSLIYGYFVVIWRIHRAFVKAVLEIVGVSVVASVSK